MSTFGNTNQTPMRHDFKRAFYRAMLSEFEIEEVKEFFAQVPLTIDDKEFNLDEVFALLWQEKAKVPFAWDCATDNALEPFLIAKGRRMDAFMNRILWLNNKSSVMPGKVLLSWFYPKLETLFNAPDARDLMVPLLTLHNENWMPNVTSQRVKRWEEGEWIKSAMVFIHDSTYSERLDWDFDIIAGPQLLASPGTLGLPHFEKHIMLGDTRHVERILWRKEDQSEYVEDNFLIGGEVYGRRMPFKMFYEKSDLDLEKFKPPNLEVTVMEKDYFCPVRSRVVLYKDCAYGAPFYLHCLAYRKKNSFQKDLLKTIVSDLVREDELDFDDLEVKHKALMALVTAKSEFQYFESDESMNFNGSNFIKGISAKILKYLLEAYLNEGRIEFEYRELKRQFDITLGQKNANFEVRFYRLVDKLESDCAGFKIEKTGRGKFRLQVKGQIQFQSRI
jgi:hypothetical protein